MQVFWAGYMILDECGCVCVFVCCVRACVLGLIKSCDCVAGSGPCVCLRAGVQERSEIGWRCQE